MEKKKKLGTDGLADKNTKELQEIEKRRKQEKNFVEGKQISTSY